VLKNLEIKKLITNLCEVLCLTVHAKGYKQKIGRKIVAYMLALEVEDLGTVDLYFLNSFDNIPLKMIRQYLVIVRFYLYKRSAR
jgi:hypothetical protein